MFSEYHFADAGHHVDPEQIEPALVRAGYAESAFLPDICDRFLEEDLTPYPASATRFVPLPMLTLARASLVAIALPKNPDGGWYSQRKLASDVAVGGRRVTGQARPDRSPGATHRLLTPSTGAT